MENRIIFMGTPAFSGPCLEALIKQSHFNIVSVYTQPDKEAGRGQKIITSPVKLLALSHDIKVVQPVSLKNTEAISQIKALAPDVVVVAAYGKIIPAEILSIPGYGCLNVHPSLLPKYRGATPIPSAILSGDIMTGVSIMLLDAGMDSGPVFKQRAEAITEDDTSSTLADRLSQIGAEMLTEILPLWLEGKIQPEPQDHNLATYTRMINKEDGRIDWNSSAAEIWRKVRALQPWPGCYTTWQGKNLKIMRCKPMDHKAGAQPGSVISLVVEGKMVAGVTCRAGTLALLQVQLEGKKAIGTDEFIRGQRGFMGSILL